jgi:hypothetical protein
VYSFRVPELWVPGAAGPLDQLVERLHRRIAEFAQRHGLAEAAVEVELADGALIAVAAISPEPGFGFVTLCPHGDDPQELVVPIGSIKQIVLGTPEPARERFGFSLPDSG